MTDDPYQSPVIETHTPRQRKKNKTMMYAALAIGFILFMGLAASLLMIIPQSVPANRTMPARPAAPTNERPSQSFGQAEIE